MFKLSISLIDHIDLPTVITVNSVAPKPVISAIMDNVPHTEAVQLIDTMINYCGSQWLRWDNHTGAKLGEASISQD